MARPKSIAARCRAAARDPRTWRQALLIGLPVGLLQAALNQGDHWWRHEIDALVVAKTILSPLLSCSIVFVSTIGTHASQDIESSSS
jgi:hypothetical protein